MVGQTISHYEVLEKLGSGGMGVVYKARDTKLDRVVALKFLPANLSRDQDAKQRFIQEAKAASSLDDPHICTIYEIGEADDGQLFIAMAFYDGSTLQELMERRQIKIDDAASIARQMAKGLAVAHEAGIVHRDVKPANVMVTRKGLVKLLDFGVAKLGESSDLTREGSTIGTASYMSPEQARGEQVDARSDIWSIGAVLYEMLTGARPFGGGYEAAVAYSIINEDPPPIAPARPDTPEGLIDVVGKALSKKAEDRYPTGGALAEELGVYSGETIVETAPQPAYKGPVHSEVPSLQKLVVRFAIGGAVALAVVYAAMMGLGLPDWVFPAAVFLTLIGLPITLYGASLEKKRAAMDSAEREGLSGLQKSFNTKKALRGGVVAGSGLLAVTLLYVILRASGIGPFASLITGGTLNEQDVLVVADFSNHTNDSALGLTVTEAFRIDLSRSTAIRLMDKSSIQSSLQRMELNPDTTLTSSLALEIAAREGAKAIVEGDINAAGNGFILNARILSGADGTELAAFRSNARSNDDILDAIDQLSGDLRAGIGESLVDIRAERPLSRVTTSNTEALRTYTRADQASLVGREEESMVLFQEAIRLDSTFAMAYRKVAVAMRNLEYPDDSSNVYLEKGYALRDNLPLRERRHVEADYEQHVVEDREKAIRIYEDLLSRYPYDTIGLNNLALLYNGSQRFPEATALARRALEQEDSYTFRSIVVISLMQQGLMEEASFELDAYEEAHPGLTTTAELRVRIAWNFDDFDTSSAFVDSMVARSESDLVAIEATEYREDIYNGLGQIGEAKAQRERRFRLRDGLFPETDPRNIEHQRLRRNVNSEWQGAYLSGDHRSWRAAFEAFVSFIDSTSSEEGEPIHDFNFIARMLNSLGYLTEAQQWHAKHLAYHQAAGTEISPNETIQVALTSALSGENVRAGIEQIEKIISGWGCVRCFRFELGELELMDGNIENAIQRFEEFSSTPAFDALNNDNGRVAMALVQLGSLYEAQGDLDAAISAYSRMAERWKDADAILQPQVEEARRRIDQLLDRKAQEPS